MSKMRTVRVTVDITLTALPRDQWGDLADIETEEFSDDAPLTEATSDEVASCLDGAITDEMFGGSMLFLSVVKAEVVKHHWKRKHD